MWEVYKQNIAAVAFALSIYTLLLLTVLPWLAYLAFFKHYWKAGVFMVLALVQIVVVALYGQMLIGW